MIESEANSCLYVGTVFHARLSPKKHQFKHRVFMFYLDLDEIPTLLKKLPLFKHYYRFEEQDYLPTSQEPLKNRVLNYLHDKGLKQANENWKIQLLSNLRILNYIFNPVSFFFCFDENKVCQAIIAEVANTFGESKAYFIPANENGTWQHQETKFFYVSPFSDLDARFDFRLSVPDDNLKIEVKTLSADGKETIIVAQLDGVYQPLTAESLYRATWQHPLMTLRVIGLIHWHALLLALKRTPFHSKQANVHWQRHVLRTTQ